MLQGLHCIAGFVLQRRGVDELCCNTLKCIVTETVELCCDTGSRHSRAGPRHSRLGAGLGVQARARRRQARGALGTQNQIKSNNLIIIIINLNTAIANNNRNMHSMIYHD